MGERPAYPTQAETTQAMIEQFFENKYVALVGTIQRYDAATQRADVVIGTKNVYPDPEGSGVQLREDFPVAANVKVLFPRMGLWFLAFSVQPGDRVQLLVNTLTPEDWMAGDGRVAGVNDTRRQHIAHAVALVGMNLNSEALVHAPVAAAPDTAFASLILGSDLADGTRLSIYGDGTLKVFHGDAEVFRIDPGAPASPPEALALAAATDAIVSSLKSLIAGWAPTGTGDGASLKSLIAGWSPSSVAAAKTKGA